ncbi:MAG: nucleotidyl transferase AbiEii/AbiGii toxin family protein [Parachlamydiales bacterium]|jgi:predicted nucleotidyltransferase component of viral defense system
MISEAILRRLESYKCSSHQEYEAALLEIIQEIALLGLWRSKFFEKAVFCGGTALRILYGLDRFSEDLDFSLLLKAPNFEMKTYHQSVVRELQSLGFDVIVEEKKKTTESAVQSAFIKANTREHFLRIGLSTEDQKRMHSNKVLKVKFEVDMDPPLKFNINYRPLTFPGPFSVATMTLPDLFAGKMHALLFREYKGWVKGRDWYDFLWFLGQKIPLGLTHLEERMRQAGHLPNDHQLTEQRLKTLLDDRIRQLDVASAAADVRRFIKDQWKIEQWSQDYFLESATHLLTTT